MRHISSLPDRAVSGRRARCGARPAAPFGVLRLRHRLSCNLWARTGAAWPKAGPGMIRERSQGPRDPVARGARLPANGTRMRSKG